MAKTETRRGRVLRAVSERLVFLQGVFKRHFHAILQPSDKRQLSRDIVSCCSVFIQGSQSSQNQGQVIADVHFPECSLHRSAEYSDGYGSKCRQECAGAAWVEQPGHEES